MRIFLTKVFRRWSRQEQLEEEQLLESAIEIEEGLIDAVLGGNLIKKRIARMGRGKSGGFRTILAYQEEKRLIFLYGFSKNERENLNPKELKALKLLSNELLGYSEHQIELLLAQEELVELTKGE